MFFSPFNRLYVWDISYSVFNYQVSKKESLGRSLKPVYLTRIIIKLSGRQTIISTFQINVIRLISTQKTPPTTTKTKQKQNSKFT